MVPRPEKRTDASNPCLEDPHVYVVFGPLERPGMLLRLGYRVAVEGQENN